MIQDDSVGPSFEIKGDNMNEISVVDQEPLSAVAIRAQVNLIQEVMKSVMKEKEHFGVIPGCQKPSLWKPGAEKLLMTFHIASEPEVFDLSTGDEARYRVVRRGTTIGNGRFVGSGVGECSSNEEKYKWRKAVCDEEFNETPEDRRREKWAKNAAGNYKTKQVRTNHADLANTVLKMADKRAYVALALNVTAASDIFTQDVEDLPEHLVEPRQEVAKAAQDHPQAQQTAKAPGRFTTISEKQAMRLFAIAMSAGWTADSLEGELIQKFGFGKTKEVAPEKYEEVCNYFGKKAEVA